MIILDRKNKKLSTSDLNLIIFYLKKGKVLVLPTDTIYGFSCLSSNKKAIKKIISLKNRPKNKPFITLVSSLSMAKKYAHCNQSQYQKLKACWQQTKRPTTIILKAKKFMTTDIVDHHQGLSMRLPKSDFLIKIIRKIKEPLISTSLNLSGQKPLTKLDDLNLTFFNKKKPDLVLDFGPSLTIKPSKLIDLRDGQVKIIRP